MRRPLRLAVASALVVLIAAVLALLVSHQHWFWPRTSIRQAIAAARPKPLPATTADTYTAAADAFRRKDLEEVRRLLGGLADRQPHERERALLVLGLHEYASGHFREATDVLQMVADKQGALEDWRLYALADAAARVGDGALSDRALAALLDRDGSSPLRGRALVLAAARAWQANDVARSMRFVALARAQKLPPAVMADVDALAWRIGSALGDRQVQRTAAKRLLVRSPAVAKDLDVAAVFRDASGNLGNWKGVLSLADVEQRAANWLASDDAMAAAGTLQTVPVAERDVSWYLLQAQALTDQGKGAVAYSLLRSVFPTSRSEAAQLEWQRALAASDVATARPGRDNLASADRQRFLAMAQQHLRRVVKMNVDAATSTPALRRLYGMLADAGRFDDAMEMLALLKQIDPTDRTGASHLWELGWAEFGKKNYSGAVGYWTQLEQIYPDDRETHRGRYWKARALEALGESGHAREIYREVLAHADTADFYVREAAARLGEAPKPEAQAGSLADAWPADPELRRVATLIDFGLDPLAKTELEALAQPGSNAEEQRDASALEGILMVRGGDARKGVQLLRAAFPDLGGPFQAAIPRPVLAAYYPLQYENAIESNAVRHDLPPALVAGIIRQESAFDSKAESFAGARGLMQLMPATAREWAQRLKVEHSPERLYDPEYSIRLGTAYFKHVLDRMDGNVPLALAGYNGGPNRILRLWRQAGADDSQLDLFLERLDISESQAYVKRILVLSDSYRQLYPAYGT